MIVGNQVGDLSGRAFRVIISYLLPGFVLLLGIAAFASPAQRLLSLEGPEASANSRLIYVLLLSLGCGLVLHVLRWAVVDSFHSATGIKRPNWDDGRLSENLSAYHALVEMYYGYYEFCANMALALAAAYIAHRLSGPFSSQLNHRTDLLIASLFVLLLAGSRDTLQRYYSRVNKLLGVSEERITPMTNGGGHHEEGTGVDPKAKPKPSPEPKASKQSSKTTATTPPRPRS